MKPNAKFFRLQTHILFLVIRMGVIDIVLQRWDNFLVNREIFWVGQTLPLPEKSTAFTQPKKPRAIPLFGADSGFGEDYAVYRVSQPQPFGPQPLEHRENVHGFIRGVGEPPLPAERGYEDPVTSPRASRTSETTDQKPISKGILTPSDVWDGIVRNEPKKKNFQTASRGHEKTEGDKQAEDLKRYPYDFSN